jgi:poly(3-hydroxybutyrate) depolymerase
MSTCDGSGVTQYTSGSMSNQPIVFDLVVNGGHALPGPDVQTSTNQSVLGWKNRDQLTGGIGGPYFAKAMWAFFSQYTQSY